MLSAYDILRDIKAKLPIEVLDRKDKRIFKLQDVYKVDIGHDHHPWITYSMTVKRTPDTCRDMGTFTEMQIRWDGFRFEHIDDFIDYTLEHLKERCKKQDEFSKRKALERG